MMLRIYQEKTRIGDILTQLLRIQLCNIYTIIVDNSSGPSEEERARAETNKTPRKKEKKRATIEPQTINLFLLYSTLLLL